MPTCSRRRSRPSRPVGMIWPDSLSSAASDPAADRKLNQQVAQLDDQQTKLTDASQKLQTRIDMFRTQKESIKAQYQASSAQVKISESFTGISREMNDIGMAVQRAQDRIETDAGAFQRAR